MSMSLSLSCAFFSAGLIVSTSGGAAPAHVEARDTEVGIEIQNLLIFQLHMEPAGMGQGESSA